MKKILITQRQDKNNIHKELRDCIDIRLIKFVKNLGYFPIPISNSIKKLNIYLKILSQMELYYQEVGIHIRKMKEQK